MSPVCGQSLVRMVPRHLPFSRSSFCEGAIPQFPYCMPDGDDGVKQYHPGARPAHDTADAFSHVLAVAVDGTFAAGRLVRPETAAVQPFHRVCKKFLTCRAEYGIPLLVPAVHPYHHLYCNLFIFNMIPHTILLSCCAHFPLLAYLPSIRPLYQQCKGTK